MTPVFSFLQAYNLRELNLPHFQGLSGNAWNLEV